MDNRKYYIGCDPGTKTGFAVFDNTLRKLTELKTTDFWGFIKEMKRFPPEVVFHLAIECPNSKTVWHKGATNRRAIERTSVNVGSAIREAELLIQWAEDRGYKILKVHPQGKYDKKFFNQITGWNKMSSKHSRDAAMLVYQQ